MKLSSEGDFSNPGLVEMCARDLNDQVFRAWTRVEHIVNINFEQKKLAAMINQIHREYFVKSATTPTVAAQGRYAIPTDLVHLWGVEIADTLTDNDPKGLVQVMLHHRHFYDTLADVNDKDDMAFYWVIGREVQLEPGDKSAGKFIRTYYVKTLTDFKLDNTDNAVVSEIPIQHHSLLYLGACRRSLAKHKRVNKVIESLYSEGVSNMRGELLHFSNVLEERREPFWGTYGQEDRVRTGTDVL